MAFLSSKTKLSRNPSKLKGVSGKIILVAALLGTWGIPAGSLAKDAQTPATIAGQRDFSGKTFRMLVVGDPFANALNVALAELDKRSGARIKIEVAGYSDVRRLILQNAKDAKSAYDVVSFDVVWVGEFAKARVLSPLQLNRAPGLQPEDFLPLAMKQSQVGPDQLGLPIQPHPELLWLRKDLLAQAGLAVPVTTDDLLNVAKKLTRPKDGQYGLCWNGQRGQALGQQMAHFYGAFGQPLLDASGRPALDTPRGLAAARFAKSLLAVSPPDVLVMAWDQRTRAFAKGTCAMTYEWAARSYLAEQNAASRVVGKVLYQPAPHAAGAPPATPLGTWSLGVPSNLGARHGDAEQFLLWLSEPAQQRLLAQSGNGGMPRLSLLNDKQLSSTYPAFPVVARLSQANALSDSMRPAVPQWADLAELMGTVFHDMLSGRLTPEAATAFAQSRAMQLFASRGP
jgi:multiple sugar transport system substrate-binding protein